ncbi:MAG TPA: hypothetical protein VGB47_07490 [Thermoanaerobaculia bacterium]
MRTWAIVAGLVLIAVVLWDVFETIILSCRVSRRLRLGTPWSQRPRDSEP